MEVEVWTGPWNNTLPGKVKGSAASYDAMGKRRTGQLPLAPEQNRVILHSRWT
jgi:hypothetical protein